MKELKGRELDDILYERQTLKAELDSMRITALYQLNDVPTTPEAERVGKKTLILMGKCDESDNDYIILSTSGRKGMDKITTWLHYGDALAGCQQKQDYIVIDKSKVGRPARSLSDAERQEIRDRHKTGESINAIAKAMHIGTRRVMAALKDYQNTF